MKSLYLIACCLFLAAVAFDFAAKNNYGTAIVTRAKSVGDTEFDRMKARERSNAEVKIGTQLGITGMIAAGLAIAAWLASLSKGRCEGKRPTPIIPLALCVAYVIELFTFV